MIAIMLASVAHLSCDVGQGSFKRHLEIDVAAWKRGARITTRLRWIEKQFHVDGSEAKMSLEVERTFLPYEPRRLDKVILLSNSSDLLTSISMGEGVSWKYDEWKKSAHMTMAHDSGNCIMTGISPVISGGSGL